ncbi:hypothetical protein [Nocardia lijiangensis]|uniref:hypothetical protein n=1 Tax=Nocardia lijiangensis TaxID=299618 RepID=UPI003D720C11
MSRRLNVGDQAQDGALIGLTEEMAHALGAPAQLASQAGQGEGDVIFGEFEGLGELGGVSPGY